MTRWLVSSLRTLGDRYVGQRMAASLGAFLAIAVFIANRSLWLDEAKLSLNFVERNFFQLLSPLDHEQVAPLGFLWAVEGLFELGRGLGIPVEYGLRLPSLLAFFGVAYLTLDVGQRILDSRLGAFSAAALVCCNGYAIRYGTEAKQYMLDTFVALLIYRVTLQVERSQRPRAVAGYAAFGAVAIWVSNTAVLFLACAGGYLLVQNFLRERSLRFIWAPLAWVASLSVYYALFVHDHPTRDYMLRYWRDAFLPWPPWSAGSPGTGAFLQRQLGGLVRDTLAGAFYVPAALLLLVSVLFALATRRYRLVLFTTGPLLLHLLASAFKLYPFAHRLVLYFVPLSAWLLGFAVGALDQALGRRRWFAALAALPVFGVLAISANRFPFQNEELRDNLRFISAHYHDGQTLYVHPGARLAFDFYASVGAPVPTQVMRGDRRGWQPPSEPPSELTRLQGQVWLLFSHLHKGGAGGEERRALAALEQQGHRVLLQQHLPGSGVYLLQMLPKAAAP